ncbi:MAG: hypothetical protein L0Z62_32675, partial [Gemmataceae bacterium]|nr:hypothetical protein [Gemmataceae bacterium]
MTKTGLALIAGAILVFVAPARADIIYSFDKSMYSVDAGGSFTANVFLTETGGGNVLRTEGVAFVGLQLNHPGLQLTGFSTNPLFAPDFTSTQNGVVQLILGAPDIFDPITAPPG